MDVQLRAATESEFEQWQSLLVAGYAAQIAASGSMSPAKAREKARLDVARTLSQGLESPGQFIYRVLAGDEPVGWLWLGTATDDPRMAWVYDVQIDAAHQGKGYGRRAMLLAEEESRAHDKTSIGLNVFGQNAVARALYESLGYQTMSVQLKKPL